ncbi:hypothetical protein CRUP_010016, partial [Coryphaenoides rupestris]
MDGSLLAASLNSSREIWSSLFLSILEKILSTRCCGVSPSSFIFIMITVPTILSYMLKAQLSFCSKFPATLIGQRADENSELDVPSPFLVDVRKVLGELEASPVTVSLLRTESVPGGLREAAELARTKRNQSQLNVPACNSPSTPLPCLEATQP